MPQFTAFALSFLKVMALMVLLHLAITSVPAAEQWSTRAVLLVGASLWLAIRMHRRPAPARRR